jgi:hypothetical protein
MIFEVLTAVKISVLVLWVIMPYGLVGTYQCFGVLYCLLHVSIALQSRRPTLDKSDQVCNTAYIGLRPQTAAFVMPSDHLYRTSHILKHLKE